MNTKLIDQKHVGLLIIALVVFLSACAPSGGESSASETEDQSTEVTQQNLEVDRDFDLRATRDFQLTVANTNSSAGEAYLSICRAKIEQGKSVIDYENCLLRLRMTDDVYTGSLKLPAHYKTLYAALWFYDVAVPPSILEISESELSSGVAYLAL